ncbi:MAG TPA: DUF2381 family protein [Myxococcaceae bacterium]|nr:DUF2381 family protein [Myxococcaceae bacterium]
MRWTWLTLTQVAVLLLGAGVAGAQEARRRTVVVAPDLPAEKGPEIAVHVENSTSLVFEAPPQAVNLGSKAGRVNIAQFGNVVTLVPSAELLPDERLPLTVTATDGSRFVFNLVDAFTGDVDSRILVRTARGPVEPEPADNAMAFLLSRSWSELEGVTYRPNADSRPGAVSLKGMVLLPGFAILLVSTPAGTAPNARFMLRAPRGNREELPVAAIQRDADGFKLAVKRPRDSRTYTLELLEPGRAPVEVATKVIVFGEAH